MKRIIVLLILLVGIFSLSSVKVNAQTFSTSERFDDPVITSKGTAKVNCDGILTPEGYAMVQEILGYIRIIAPSLAVILIALDIASAVVSQDNDALGKASKKIVPRLIGVALLFFVPTIVRAILGLDGIKGEIVIADDPLCHTMTVEKVNVNNYEFMI